MLKTYISKLISNLPVLAKWRLQWQRVHSQPELVFLQEVSSLSFQSRWNIHINVCTCWFPLYKKDTVRNIFKRDNEHNWSKMEKRNEDCFLSTELKYYTSHLSQLDRSIRHCSSPAQQFRSNNNQVRHQHDLILHLSWYKYDSGWLPTLINHVIPKPRKGSYEHYAI